MMRMLLGTALAALTIAITGPARAQTPGTAESAVACEVAGYDVIIVNQGIGPIPAGTRVEWSVPFARMQGELSLAKALEPDRPVFLTGALGSSYLTPDTDCQASAR